MICRFQSQRCSGQKPLPAVEAVAGAPGAVEQPLSPVLDRLRGQEIVLTLVGGRQVCGKLIRTVPVTLADCHGQVAVVVSLIQSVQF